MQVMPGTWPWVQDQLARRRLDAAPAQDDVRAGALHLGGLASVRRIRMYEDTERDVADVQALRARFGG